MILRFHESPVLLAYLFPSLLSVTTGQADWRMYRLPFWSLELIPLPVSGLFPTSCIPLPSPPSDRPPPLPWRGRPLVAAVTRSSVSSGAAADLRWAESFRPQRAWPQFDWPRGGGGLAQAVCGGRDVMRFSERTECALILRQRAGSGGSRTG